MLTAPLDPQIRKDGRDGKDRKDRKDGTLALGFEVRRKTRIP